MRYGQLDVGGACIEACPMNVNLASLAERMIIFIHQQVVNKLNKILNKKIQIKSYNFTNKNEHQSNYNITNYAICNEF